MITHEKGSIVLLDFLYYNNDIFIYASYSLLIYVWVSSYIIAHQKPNSWLSGIRIVLVSLNVIFWTAMYATLGANPDRFIAGKGPTIIVAVMLITGGVEFLVLARKLEMVAKDETMADLEVVAGSVAHKISSRTYWTCVVVFIVGIIFILLSSIAFVNLTVTYFVVRHSIYAMLEAGLTMGMILILHRKKSLARNHAKLPKV